MAYGSGGLIEAVDYNGFVASVNAVWGTGSTPNVEYGWGQTSLSNVAASNTITGPQWAALIETIDKIRLHESNVNSGIAVPGTGGVITFLSTLSTVISTGTNSRFSTAAFGTATNAPALSNATGWTITRQLEIQITWSGGANAMRYFFNAGGKINFSGSSSSLSGNSKSTDWQTLLNNCGTIGINAKNSPRESGSGGTYNTNIGFYANGVSGSGLSTTNKTILTQTSPTTLGSYNLNTATFSARLNAAAGSSTSLFVNMLLNDGSPDNVDDTVTGTTTLTCSVIPPWSTHISNTWGAVTFTNTITG